MPVGRAGRLSVSIGEQGRTQQPGGRAALSHGQPDTRYKTKRCACTGGLLKLILFRKCHTLSSPESAAGPLPEGVCGERPAAFPSLTRRHCPARVTRVPDASSSCCFLHFSIPREHWKGAAWCFPADSGNYRN